VTVAARPKIALLTVDLTGSRLGPGWRSVELVLDGQIPYWPRERIRRAAARYYEVPIAQVGEPRIVPDREREAVPS
jgi:hypothetical protein